MTGGLGPCDSRECTNAKTDVNTAYCSSEILDTKDVLHVVHGKLDLCFPKAIAAYKTSHHRQNQLFLAQETPAKNSCLVSEEWERCSLPHVW